MNKKLVYLYSVVLGFFSAYLWKEAATKVLPAGEVLKRGAYELFFDCVARIFGLVMAVSFIMILVGGFGFKLWGRSTEEKDFHVWPFWTINTVFVTVAVISLWVIRNGGVFKG